MNTRKKSALRKNALAIRPQINSGDLVECIDAEGWLIQEPREFTPRKGGIYVVREYTTEFGVGALSLEEGCDDTFYRACRFRKATKK